MTDMLWIVPTRSRPWSVEEQINAINRTRCYTDILYVVDVDDPNVGEYSKVIEAAEKKYNWLKMDMIQQHLMLGPKLNLMANAYAKSYDFIGFMGDDHRPRTPIWDGLMGAQLRKMKTGLAYGNDLFQKQNLPTAVCMTTDIISTLGYMIPPEIEHLYCDNFWLEMGRVLGRISYREDIIIEHVHPHAGKGASDEQYERVNSGEQSERDREGFERYKRERFADDIKKLMGLIK